MSEGRPLSPSRVARRLLRPAWRRLAPPSVKWMQEYYQFHGRAAYLPWRPPVTFTDKTQWRMLKDRRERLKVLNDKLAVKDIGERFGVDSPRTLWAGTDPAELAAASRAFTGRWVLKPNHASQVVHHLDGPLDEATAARLTHGWLDLDLSTVCGEWHTSFARPLILAEESIAPPDGADLPDYKFFVFDGRPVVMYLVSGRRGVDPRMTFYRLPQWEKVEVARHWPPSGDPVPAPAELSQMMEVASRLGSGWDFLRVDLYARDGHVWLGELTATPDGARVRYDTPEFDAWLGSHWTLPTKFGPADRSAAATPR